MEVMPERLLELLDLVTASGRVPARMNKAGTDVVARECVQVNRSWTRKFKCRRAGTGFTSRPVFCPHLAGADMRRKTGTKYVVPGVIVEGLTLLAGKPKLGKSWLLLHMAIAVARGGFNSGRSRWPRPRLGPPGATSFFEGGKTIVRRTSRQDEHEYYCRRDAAIQSSLHVLGMLNIINLGGERINLRTDLASERRAV